MYLELDRLSKQFDGKYAVHDLSLGLEEGGLLCILGSSGCGKTTTLNMIGGFLKPDGGRVLLDGQDITALPPERRPVSTVFQSYGLFPHMSVLQNVTYGLKFRGYSRTEAKEKGRRYLSLVGLAERENARIGELSGGQQQRVALARALIVEPKLCLLDEPLSNLDAALRVRMRGELKRLQRELGTTMVFVTHDQEEALTMSDQIILLHDGQIEQQGDPFTIYSQPASVFASDFLGKANLLSGVLACEDGVWCVCSENVRIPVNHVGGREGDTVKTAVRGEYFEFCTPETEGANPFHLEKKIFTGLSWKLIGTLGTQPLDISALGTHAGTLSEGDDLFVRIRPENVVYYNNN